MDLEFRSSLPPTYAEALERLVFFNPAQSRSHEDIIQALELYGSPQIVAEAEGLRVAVSRRHDVQCLFALARRPNDLDLAGVLLYLRLNLEEIVVVHIAVADGYTSTRQTGMGIVIRLVRALRSAAHVLRGVRQIRILYKQGRQFSIPIRGAAAPARHEAPRIAIAS